MLRSNRLSYSPGKTATLHEKPSLIIPRRRSERRNGSDGLAFVEVHDANAGGVATLSGNFSDGSTNDYAGRRDDEEFVVELAMRAATT